MGATEFLVHSVNRRRFAFSLQGNFSYVASRIQRIACESST